MENRIVVQGYKLLKAMGNLKRLKIMYVLLNGEKKVGELEKIVGLSQSALSQHLAVLRAAGLVKTRRQAQTVLYSIKSREAIWLLQMLAGAYK